MSKKINYSMEGIDITISRALDASINSPEAGQVYALVAIAKLLTRLLVEVSTLATEVEMIRSYIGTERAD